MISICALSLSLVLGRFIHLYCDTGSLGKSTPAWEVKLFLFFHIPNIFAVHILSKTGKIYSLIANILWTIFNWYWSQDFDKFLAFFDVFFGCALWPPLIDTLSFQQIKWAIPEKTKLVWGFGISRGIEEIASEFSRG